MSLRNSLLVLMEGKCFVCGKNIHPDNPCEMIFPDNNFRIHRVCNECYKEAYIKTNKGRIYGKKQFGGVIYG